MAYDREHNLIRLSAARAKIRSAYAAPLEVCISSFVAGVVLFVVSAGIYLCVSMMKSWSGSSPTFSESVATLTEFFRLPSLGGESASREIMNLGLISGAFGVLGAVAGMILRHKIRKEPSDRFFRRRVRIPLDVLPFVAFFAYAGLPKQDLIALYLAAALAVGYLWRFWHRMVLSVVSSFDVNRFIPQPV